MRIGRSKLNKLCCKTIVKTKNRLTIVVGEWKTSVEERMSNALIAAD